MSVVSYFLYERDTGRYAGAVASNCWYDTDRFDYTLEVAPNATPSAEDMFVYTDWPYWTGTQWELRDAS